ncbi:MAG: pilus assembly protein [Endozoicomonas sp.]|uniref:pilus assembly protein n=1 Tax=Endozoicomonas sp. TaxID=1892382 RepID=UPI003D9B8496
MNRLKGISLPALCILTLFCQQVMAASTDYSAIPSQGSTTSPPLVMLAMPVDQQLFQRAYSDYTDLDGDDLIDTTYKDDFNYTGYFDNNWCYEYSNSNNFYRPVQQATGTNGHFCENALAPWSGNFMNWVAMSRIEILRSILYGGQRSTDTSSQTVLRRAPLSTDLSGAFAKVYSASDINKYTPYNSPTSFCSVWTGSPSLRIANGQFPRWASTESAQCQWGRSFSPDSSNELATLTVQVEACVSGKDASNTQRCKQYPTGVPKPIGLLQLYGEDNRIHFGLITGSYGRNSSGGLLRRNIRQFAGNTNASDDEINLSNGTFNTGVQGIIHNINAIGLTAWRNPISEIYLEAVRYFSGSSAGSPAFSTSDAGRGMTNETWVTPLDTTNACASCAIILISSGTNVFDLDDLGSSSDVTGLSGVSDLESKTDLVGNIEYNGSFSGSYFYGGNSNSCTAKPLSTLSDAIGICPDAPRRKGSYAVAGLAFHAQQTDLRTNLDGIQNIKTYTIQLADDLPSLGSKVNGNTFNFQPLCSYCTFKDLVVDNLAVDGSTGSFTFIWEDCQEGCDNDYDSSSSISYCTANACSPSLSASQIKLTSRFEGKLTSGNPSFSFSIFGTNNDGLATPFASGPDGGNAQGQGTPIAHTYEVTGMTSGVLPNPLELAAKYGGFNDLDNDGTPNHDANGDGVPDNDSREWDIRNNATGALGTDNIPDNFFLANNPSLLRTQLELVFRDIASRISSGTSAALVSNSASGVGSAIQGLFRPKVTVNDIEISWVGLVHSLFVDAKGHFREDTNANRTLDDYTTDRIVTLFFDPTSNSTVIQRYTSSDDGVTLTPDGSTVDLTELEPVWDARERLMEVSNITSQRNYTALSNTGRHILTWLDANNNGRVDTGEEQSFVSATFSGTNSDYLGVNVSESDKLVKYIRGDDQTGYRSRSVDFDNDGDLEVWRLGDIIHSNPIAVSKPEGYYSDSKPFNSNDTTFIEFQNHYENRRQVVYVGANDGMIHAFNAGFWNDSNQRFDLNSAAESQHPLGGELWAYTPMNLLPHLRWLSEPDYPHVYYMDGEPLIFDANIFTPDTDHPKGWGTVLVMGMRLGGGPIDVSVNSATRTMRSAYVMLDITNPEKPPKLMAEITHPELGFTTNRPVVIQRRQPNASGDFNFPTENNWYLAFGSGPTGTGLSGIRQALDDATSDQNMKVFVYDLQNKNFLSAFDPMDSGIATAYAGNMATVDWNQDYYDDAIYFGSVETTGNLSGELLRINLEDPLASNWTLGTLTRPQRPITARPTAVTNSDNERWVFVGTGRELTQTDSRNIQQEYFFGVKEPTLNGVFSFGTVPFSGLVDTTDIQVEADGDLVSGFSVGSSTVNNFESLRSALTPEAGWKNRLIYDGLDPGGKSVSSPANAFALLLFTEYQPPADQCLVDGTSFLNALHYQTGTAIPASIQAVLTPDGFTDDTVSNKKISLGAGLAPAPVIHQGSDGKTSIIIQGGAGNISSTDLEYTLTDDGRQSWRQIFNIPR